MSDRNRFLLAQPQPLYMCYVPVSVSAGARCLRSSIVTVYVAVCYVTDHRDESKEY